MWVGHKTCLSRFSGATRAGSVYSGALVSGYSIVALSLRVNRQQMGCLWRAPPAGAGAVARRDGGGGLCLPGRCRRALLRTAPRCRGRTSRSDPPGLLRVSTYTFDARCCVAPNRRGARPGGPSTRRLHCAASGARQPPSSLSARHCSVAHDGAFAIASLYHSQKVCTAVVAGELSQAPSSFWRRPFLEERRRRSPGP